MKLLLAIILIALIALIGSRLTFFSRRLTLGFKNIIFTGTEYIFLGFFLGSQALGVLDPLTLKQFEPFLLFGLGWVGFLFGLQFEVRRMRLLPRRYFSITAIQATIVFILVSVVSWGALRGFDLLPQGYALEAAVILGSAAACTAQSAIAIVNHNFRIENKGLIGLMRYISSVDGLFALIFFGLSLSFLPCGGAAGFDPARSAVWLMLSLAMGILPALILICLSRTRFNAQEYTVFLIGTIMFCGGLADRFQYSALVAGLVCGMVTANFCPHRLRALSMVAHGEKAIYIALLILLGAGWQFRADMTLVLAVLYFLVRAAGKVIGIFSATWIFKPRYAVPPRLGLGMISEGGLAIAVIINAVLIYPQLADTLITIIVLSVIVNEYISPALIVKQLGEVLHLSEARFQAVKKHDRDSERI